MLTLTIGENKYKLLESKNPFFVYSSRDPMPDFQSQRMNDGFGACKYRCIVIDDKFYAFTPIPNNES